MSATGDSSVPKSCKNCPSFLRKEDTPGVFKRGLGAPMCMTYGHVLGKPGLKASAEDSVCQAFAKECPAYGQPKPELPPEMPSLRVTTPDTDVLTAGAPSDDERAKVNSCLGCANFVQERAVITDLGWPAGLCSATGRLILSNRTGTEARNCMWRCPGNGRDSTVGMTLLPIYEDAFGLDADPVTQFLKNRGKAPVEPQSYPTDRPVDTDEAEKGIRAWRKVTDPAGSGRHTFLPIYDREHFDPIEQSFIPMIGDDEAPEHYVDHNGAVYKIAVLWQELDETPALWGQAGVGKTELFRHLAWLMGLPFVRISITETSEVDDLLGKFTAEADGHGGTSTTFLYGRIVKAWMKPCVLLLDEPNTGPDAVWQRVRPLTDNSKQLVLDEHAGEKIARDDSCYFGMAMNPAWDVRNTGVRPLADADGNRLAHIQMELPPEALERAILEQRCQQDDYALPKSTLDAMMKIAEDVRKASEDFLPVSWGIRPQIKVARATRWFDLRTCYRLAVTDSLEPEQAAFVLKVVSDYVTDDGEVPDNDASASAGSAW